VLGIPAVRWTRRVFGCLLPALALAVVGGFAGPPLLAPAADVVVPPSCTVAHAHLPATGMVQLPGGVHGFRLLRHHAISVLLRATDGTTPFRVHLLVVNAAGSVLRTLTFPNDVVAAGVAGTRLILYNNKIGYFFSLPSGALWAHLVWIDKYRGLFRSGSRTSLNTNVSYSALAADGRPTVNRDVTLAAVANGCWFPPTS